MKNWIKNNTRATVAIAGCFILWSGIAMKCGLEYTLMATGVLMIIGVLMSFLPDEI